MQPLRLSAEAAQAGSRRLEALGLGRARIALGTAGLGGAFGPVERQASVEALLWSLEKGLCVWDTAPSYGDAELFIGEALRQWRGPRPVVSTKVGRTHLPSSDPSHHDYSPTALRDTLKRSLDRLGLDAVDLLFLHEPNRIEPARQRAALDALLELREQGLARHLGLGGGTSPDWGGLIDSGAFQAAILFLRLDASCLAGLSQDVPNLRERNLAVIGGSPLHMGFLAGRVERAGWLGPSVAAGRQRLCELAQELGTTMVELAHRFAYSLSVLDRLLIGPRSLEELEATMGQLGAGVLDSATFDRIASPLLAEALPAKDALDDAGPRDRPSR